MDTVYGALFLTCCVICLQINQSVTVKRPIYNIAHMANTIREVNYYLNKGANAIEADVTFSPEGEALYTHHGSPCDCFRLCNEKENLSSYLKYIREIASPASPRYRKDLSLLILDLKVSDLPGHSKFRAGDTLAEKIIESLWEEATNETLIHVLISIGHTTDSPVIRGFRDTLEKRNMLHMEETIGWDINMGDSLQEIDRTWRTLGMKSRLWQGDGNSNCVIYQSTGRLEKALEERNANNTFDKIYHWTVDLSSRIRDSLRKGVDGIVTNYPERVNLILGESEFLNNVRLANILDDPWERTYIPPEGEEGTTEEGIQFFRSRGFSIFDFVRSSMETVSAFGGYVANVVRYYFRSEEWSKAEQQSRL